MSNNGFIVKIPTFDDAKNAYVLNDMKVTDAHSLLGLVQETIQQSDAVQVRIQTATEEEDAYTDSLVSIILRDVAKLLDLILHSTPPDNEKKLSRAFAEHRVLVWAFEKVQTQPRHARSSDVPLHDASASAAASGRAQGCAALEAGSVGPASAPAPTEDA